MPYYSLFVVETGQTCSGVVAQNCEEAIVKFDKKIGKSLTLEDQDIVAPYLLGERDGDPVGPVPTPEIPVFDAPD